MKKIIHIIIIIILFISCNRQPEYEYSTKVVNAKTVIKGNYYLIAFEDGSDTYVTFGLYSLVEKGDTMVFKHVEGLSFNKWNSLVVSLHKNNTK